LGRLHAWQLLDVCSLILLNTPAKSAHHRLDWMGASSSLQATSLAVSRLGMLCLGSKPRLEKHLDIDDATCYCSTRWAKLRLVVIVIAGWRIRCARQGKGYVSILCSSACVCRAFATVLVLVGNCGTRHARRKNFSLVYCSLDCNSRAQPHGSCTNSRPAARQCVGRWSSTAINYQIKVWAICTSAAVVCLLGLFPMVAVSGDLSRVDCCLKCLILAV
jgi:hypothetical protein